jgi:hypothetical protein
MNTTGKGKRKYTLLITYMIKEDITTDAVDVKKIIREHHT